MRMSTEVLRTKISEWIDKPEIVAEAIGMYLDLDAEELAEIIPSMADKLNCEPLLYDIKNTLIKNWIDSSNWKRYEKSKLKKEAPYWQDFVPDVTGEAIEQNAITEQCIWRMFVNITYPFEDNFRIEIVTNEKDDAVLAWNLIVD